jgi:flavin reductase (DIM6/NTAB) family NADH-FMN oxidoreductase RutF
VAGVTEGLGAAYDDLVARLDAAMVVVTAADGDERDGCLVGFHSQMGLDPRRYVVWLSVANRTYRIAQRATHLAVHAIDADQHDLAEHLGGLTGDDVDKLADLEWSPGPGGVPLLAELPARLVGRIVVAVDAEADHVGFVLDPVEVVVAGGGDPLRLTQATDITAGHPVERERDV